MDLTTIKTNSRNVTLQWVKPYDNNAPILQYRVNYLPPSFVEAEVTINTTENTEALIRLVILNLHPGETYSFTITAINEEGDSEKSDPLIVTTLEEGIFMHIQ